MGLFLKLWETGFLSKALSLNRETCLWINLFKYVACLISSYSKKGFRIWIAAFESEPSHGGGFSISSIFYLFLKQLRFRYKMWVHIFILVLCCHVSSNVLKRLWDKQSFCHPCFLYVHCTVSEIFKMVRKGYFFIEDVGWPYGSGCWKMLD